MPRSDCPDPDELRRYLLALVPEDHASRLEEHLSECAACESVITSLQGSSDTLLTVLHTPYRNESFHSDPDFRAAVESAKRFLPAAPAPFEARVASIEPTATYHARQQKFGPYQLQEMIGRGGMGVVYRAVHMRLDKRVAIKILPSSSARSKELVARFKREMKAIGRLSHPRLVEAYDARETPDKRYLYLVMELIDGHNVSSLLRRQGPLPVGQVCEIIRQAAIGLEYVHQQGLVHRDVKPSNLMLTANGEVKILDLGLALLEDRRTEELTSRGQVMGTPEYMAPEQALDSHQVDQRADIYSLGCTLYSLLVGRSPYAARKLVQVVLAHRDAPIPSLCEARADVPDALDSVFRKMVAKRPEDRQQSMGEVVAELDAVLGREIPPSVLPAEPTASAVSVATGSQPIRRRPPLRRVLTLVGAFFVFLALLSIILIVRRNGRQTTLTVPAESDIKIAEGGQRIEVSLGQRGQQAQAGAIAARGTDWPTDSPVHKPGSPPPAIAPFDEKHAKEHQQAWAQHLGVPAETTNSIGMKLVLIPPGEFDMGSTADEIRENLENRKMHKGDDTYRNRVPSEGPRHKVTISQAFYLGAYDVTQGEYERVMGINPSSFAGKQMDLARFIPPLDEKRKQERIAAGKKTSGRDTSDHPVETVSWEDATEFCRRMSALPGERASHRVYRLPTEAEWEYACRAGTASTWSCGDVEAALAAHAWFGDNAGETTQPVGQKKPNAWNLYDMHGSVWQWCSDWFGNEYFRHAPSCDPPGSRAGNVRVLRGGAWNYNSFYGRCAFRFSAGPSVRAACYGLRVVMMLPAKRS